MISFDAIPLDKYSSVHKISLLGLLGIKSKFSPKLSIAFNFNLKTTIPQSPQAQLTFNIRDFDSPLSAGSCDFYIGNLTRWRLNIPRYDSFADFLQKIKRSHFRKYQETQKTFTKYGASISFIEDDWSQHADTVYQLYHKVAERHGAQLYDLAFFRRVASLSEYKLLCVWYNGAMISALVIIDEEPVFHSMVCGLDYAHSKKSHAYSRMHYEFIRLAIDSKKHSIADIGLTADKAKALMDFEPALVRMEISARNFLVKGFLRFLSRFTRATLNEETKLELNFHFSRK